MGTISGRLQKTPPTLQRQEWSALRNWRHDPRCLVARCTRPSANDPEHNLLSSDSFSSVRFQKWLRLFSLEIPEPGATGYQNLMRQDSKLTRSDATKFGRRLKCPQITALLECVTAPGQDGMRFALFLFKFSVFNDLYRKQVFRAADHTYRNPLYPSSPC
jgi:hypothetical protein